MDFIQEYGSSSSEDTVEDFGGDTLSLERSSLERELGDMLSNSWEAPLRSSSPPGQGPEREFPYEEADLSFGPVLDMPSLEPAPAEPAPAEPAPSEPAPSEPAPAEPAPSEPAPAEPPCPAEGYEVEVYDEMLPARPKPDVWSRLGPKVLEEEVGPCERKACRPTRPLTPLARPASSSLPGNIPPVRPMGNVPEPVPRNPQPQPKKAILHNPPGYDKKWEDMLAKRHHDDDNERKQRYEERKKREMEEKEQRRKKKKK